MARIELHIKAECRRIETRIYHTRVIESKESQGHFSGSPVVSIFVFGPSRDEPLLSEGRIV